MWSDYITFFVCFYLLKSETSSQFLPPSSFPWSQDNGVEFRIWSRESAEAQTEWSSDIGPRILAYYETYFDTPFPLPKQDMIAIPDFSAGAMENWGLITYRETALLYQVNNKQPSVSSVSIKISRFSVSAGLLDVTVC